MWRSRHTIFWESNKVLSLSYQRPSVRTERSSLVVIEVKRALLELLGATIVQTHQDWGYPLEWLIGTFFYHPLWVQRRSVERGVGSKKAMMIAVQDVGTDKQRYLPPWYPMLIKRI